ncbi:ImmA/IrrE family metallo-endopeptidase [Sphingomonas sp.]|uniref:ImmA/IrrE family metallo-endopeptidase n=1 Tax=Sphingomonas sp. TaxID=28214 RepID=UPI003AFF90B5
MNTMSFGSRERFAVTIGWIDDGSPARNRPKGHGFSLGSLELVVNGYSLTAHLEDETRHDSVRWYLLPIFRWAAENWRYLFHEEDFSWPERTEEPGAIACNVALERFLPPDHSERFAVYDQVQAWWQRHALRAGASGGLLPDVFLRRLGDGVELSWSAREADFAPPGYKLIIAPGVAVLPVKDVATPLWGALRWLLDTAKVPDAASRTEIDELCALVEGLRGASDREVRQIYLGDKLAGKVENVFRGLGKSDLLVSQFDREVPVVEVLAAPVAMFGGVDPNLTLRDVRSLSNILVTQLREVDTAELDRFVDRSVSFPLIAAYDEGYELAEALLDDLGISLSEAIDIEQIFRDLGITLLQRQFDTHTIRGVALAGSGLAPTVIINKNSPFSRNEAGRRFTMAHELCHILYDQSRARRVTQASGPWAPSGIEKRANAFAAMLLMPRALIDQHLRRYNAWSEERVRAIASDMKVSFGALTEHLYNLGYINEADREELRLH